MARRDTGPDPKEAPLAAARCLNPHPDQVRDPACLASDILDAPAPARPRWRAAVSATPKAAGLAAREMRKDDAPSPSLLPSPGHAAAEPGTRPDAGQDHVPGGGLDARYEQLRHAALHARAEAFP